MRGIIYLIIYYTFCVFGNKNFQEIIKSGENKYKRNSSLQINETGVSFIVEKPNENKKDEIIKIFFSYNMIDTSVIHIMLKDYNQRRWEVPDFCIGNHSEYILGKYKTSNVTITDEPFSLSIKEADNPQYFAKIFGERLVFYDKFIEFDVMLQTNRIFGLGERAAHFALSPGTYTMWNHGAPNPFDDGVNGGKNMYSSHPFYVSQLSNHKQFTAIYFKNSNAQDAIIETYSDNKYRVIHRTIGGIIELFIFYPGTIQNIIKKYHILIGKPYLPAFWSMGSQQSKWGYRSKWDIQRLLNNYEYYEIPLDGVTLDIDYMDEYAVFTIDDKRYPKLDELVDNMHSKGINLVTIHDPGVKIKDKYNFYER